MNNDAPSDNRLPIIVTIVVVLGIVAYFIPSAPSSSAAAHIVAHHVRLALTVFMAACFCASALLYVLDLTVFRSSLRVAYRWFSAGNILFALAMLQWPVIVLSGQERSFWALSGMVALPFLLATLLMYVGMRRFALLLGIKSIATSGLLTAALVAGGAVASGFLAHWFAFNNTPGVDTETYTAVVAWSTGYGVLAWILIRKVAGIVGPHYQRAMHKQVVALGVLSLGGLHEYITSFFVTENDSYVYWGTSLWVFIIASLLFIVASHAMGLTRYAAARDATNAAMAPSDNHALIDDVMNTVALVSRPESVDDIMDGLRAVTSGMQDDAPLTDAQQTQLAQVYIRLEEYLASSDPLRTFTPNELRARLVSRLRERVDSLSPIQQNVNKLAS